MITVKTETNFTLDRVTDLLCTALEGGSNYWADFSCNIKDFYGISDPEWTLVVYDREDEYKKYLVDYNDLARGLQTLTSIARGRHFKDFLFENEDAITGDCFLQCCVFDDVIYG